MHATSTRLPLGSSSPDQRRTQKSSCSRAATVVQGRAQSIFTILAEERCGLGAMVTALWGAPVQMQPYLPCQARGQLRSPCWHSTYRPCRGRLQVMAATVNSNDFRPGTTLEMEGAPYRVMEFLHVKPGKGAAFVRTKLRNFITGNQQDKTFRAGENVEAADIDKRGAQFTYQDGDDYIFMDSDTYEEQRVKQDDLWSRYLKEGQDVQLVLWKDMVISVDLPKVLELEVVQTDPNVKGNTAAGGSKPATLETGAVVQVPLFIAAGEKIRVDTKDNSYGGRADK